MNVRVLSKNLIHAPAFRAVILFIIVVLVLAIGQPATLGNFGIVLSSVVDVWLVALALTPLLILGEIDLSVGATMAVAAGVTVQSSDNLLFGIAIAISTGLVIGLINGLLVVKVGINSFVTTLGMMIALQGLALAITGGEPIPVENTAAALAFSNPILAGITPDILVAISITLFLLYFISNMRSGRDLFAIGSNPDAAMAAGIPVARRKILSFVLCSAFSAVAGAVITLNLVAASPILGSTVMLMAIAAAVIGGARLSGGRGSILGSAIGAVAIGGINVGLQMAGFDTTVVDIIVGSILFLAIVFTKDIKKILRLPSISFRGKNVSLQPSTEGVINHV